MLGIYYFNYSTVIFPKFKRKLIIAYTRSDLLEKIVKAEITDDYYCWLKECETPGFLSEGKLPKVRAWVDTHLPEKYGDPWKP